MRSMFSKSMRSSSAASSSFSGIFLVSYQSIFVHSSSTMSTSGWAPVIAMVKLRRRSACQPGFKDLNHSGSVGLLLRAPTHAAVRWKT